MSFIGAGLSIGTINAIAAGTVAAGVGAAGYGASKLLKGKGGESRLEDFQYEKYFEDPDYRKTQDFLGDYGIDMLKGDIDPYYAPIGESGGPEFENYLSMIKGDIQKSALESSAALGRGGGRAMDVASKNIGRFSTEARYKDYTRALEGKKYLFGQGREITEGVRGAGQQEGANRNLFNLKQQGTEISLAKYLEGFDQEQEAMKGEFAGKVASTAINAGVGYATGGPVGALAGAMGGVKWDEVLQGAISKKSKGKAILKTEEETDKQRTINKMLSRGGTL